MKQEQFTAWAIDSRSPEGHGLLGRYFFNERIPPSLEGCRIALFKTRKIAREYCSRAPYGPYGWNLKVVKVQCVLKELK